MYIYVYHLLSSNDKVYKLAELFVPLLEAKSKFNKSTWSCVSSGMQSSALKSAKIFDNRIFIHISLDHNNL